MTDATQPEDFVDRVRVGWAETYPNIDTRPIDVVGRITRISSLVLAQLDRELVPSGVTRPEFEVLCALARSESPLRASEVTSVTGLSGASTTKHADRLVGLGLVERQRFERDGRVVLLALTDAGRAVVDTEFPRHLTRERHLLDGFTDGELDTLTALLRRLTREVEAQTRP